LNTYLDLQSYASSPRIPPEQWRSKSHLNLWPVHSRNRRPITRKARWRRCLNFQVVTNAVRGRDFA
jgi:hypothetical protein